jgi:hypothetical protein
MCAKSSVYDGVYFGPDYPLVSHSQVGPFCIRFNEHCSLSRVIRLSTTSEFCYMLFSTWSLTINSSYWGPVDASKALCGLEQRRAPFKQVHLVNNSGVSPIHSYRIYFLPRWNTVVHPVSPALCILWPYCWSSIVNEVSSVRNSIEKRVNLPLIDDFKPLT